MLSSLCFPRTVGGVERHIYFLTKSLLEQGHHLEIAVPILERSPDRSAKRPTISVIERTYDGMLIHELHVHLSGLIRVITRMRERFAGASAFEMLAAFSEKSAFQLVAKQLAIAIDDIMRKSKLDLIHQHDFSANIFSTRRLSARYPVVLTNHTGEFLYLVKNFATRFYLRFALAHYAKIIGPSRELSEVPWHGGKSVYIPNGVDTDFYQPAEPSVRDKLREGFGIPKNSFVVLCPRRWAPTKGILYLFNAVKSVVQKAPETIILFAGSDSQGYPAYRRKIEDVIQSLQSRGINNFRLLGTLDAASLFSYYQAADAVVIPSLMEATSLAALEGMSVGRTVLSTRIGGMPDIITHGSNGFLVDPADSEALASALSYIKGIGKEGREQVGNKAREFVLLNHQWKYIASRTAGIYGEAARLRF